MTIGEMGSSMERRKDRNEGLANRTFDILKDILKSGDTGTRGTRMVHEPEEEVTKRDNLKVVDLQSLDAHLKSGQITHQQYTELARMLLAKHEYEGAEVAHVAKNLSTKNEQISAVNENLEKERGLDKLTGLSNDPENKLAELIENLPTVGDNRKSSFNAIVVIAMDLNRFKFLNDTYGHTAGNQALRAFAERQNKT